DMVLQHLVLDLAQRRADRLDLRQHVDAVTVVLDHPLDAAHLALDAAQARAAGGLRVRLHRLTLYPPRVYLATGKASADLLVSSVEATTRATDPVCGMSVDPATAPRAEHEGRAYYFCCAGCRDKFRADPQRCLAPLAPCEAPAPAGVLYTCPMHPELL